MTASQAGLPKHNPPYSRIPRPKRLSGCSQTEDANTSSCSVDSAISRSTYLSPSFGLRQTSEFLCSYNHDGGKWSFVFGLQSGHRLYHKTSMYNDEISLILMIVLLIGYSLIASQVELMRQHLLDFPLYYSPITS